MLERLSRSASPDFPGFVREDLAAMEPSRIVQLWQMGFGRKDLIPLWVGEGDLPTPEFISDAAVAALRAGETFYTHKRGIPELRQAVADYTGALYGVPTGAEQITITSSGMNAIMLVLQAMIEPGDKVVVVSPCWPNIVSAVEIVNGCVEEVALEPTAEGGFRLDLERLFAAVDERTRALFINSPGNPTGWMMEPEEQQAVLEWCRKRGIWIIADEVYARFVYDRPVAPSFLQQAEPEDVVIQINSFSKAWAMTGWRLGWVVAPPALGDLLDQLIEFNTSGAQAFLQRGGIAALGRDGEAFAQALVERCRLGGELVFQRLSACPRVRIARPRASFYSFFAVEGVEDSLAFAKRLLAETGVGLAPGSAFGSAGEGHLRLCFASAPARLSLAMDRLEPLLR